MQETNPDRRAFLQGLVRAGLLGGLTLTGALLVWRRLRDGSCDDDERCSRCGVHAMCPVRRDREEVRS
jgi:hypothetical protein